MEQSYRDIATREANACNRFVAWACEQIDCTEEEARSLLHWYRIKRCIKIDVNVGQFSLAHGAFGDPEILRAAVKAARQSEKKALGPMRTYGEQPIKRRKPVRD